MFSLILYISDKLKTSPFLILIILLTSINSFAEISGFIKESILTNGPEIKLHSRLILESIIS